MHKLVRKCALTLPEILLSTSNLQHWTKTAKSKYAGSEIVYFSFPATYWQKKLDFTKNTL